MTALPLDRLEELQKLINNQLRGYDLRGGNILDAIATYRQDETVAEAMEIVGDWSAWLATEIDKYYGQALRLSEAGRERAEAALRFYAPSGPAWELAMDGDEETGQITDQWLEPSPRLAADQGAIAQEALKDNPHD